MAQYSLEQSVSVLQAERDRLKALVAELVGALEAILTRADARGTLEVTCDGSIADVCRAVLARAKEIG